jgi:capsular exopolysaccharide synthesis family protein
MKLGFEQQLLEAASAVEAEARRRRAPGTGQAELYSRSLTPEALDMREGGVNLQQYLHLALKYRWLLICAIALGIAGGVGATLLTTPVYRASATIQIDEEPAKVVAVESQRPSQTSGADKFYQTQYELLKSRALAQRVVAREGLANNPRFMGQWRNAPAAKAPARTAADRAARTAIAAGLVSEQLQIEPVRLSRIVRISYESPDRAMAANIANAVAANYITWNLERRYEASSAARRFLQDRLEQTRQTLEEAQRRGNDYAQRNQLITVESAGGDGGKIATGESLLANELALVNGQLATATATRIQAEQRWRQASITPDAGMPELLASPALQSLKVARDTAWSEYQQNLRVFKPDWPAMVDARKKIEGLDAQIAAQAASIRSGMLTDLNVARRNEIQFENEVAERKQQLLVAQGKRVEQSFINTDINTSRSLYDGMLASFKEIGLAGGISDNNVSIVDRAETPGEAVKPRMRNNLIQFGLAGLLLGALAAFLLERFDLSMKTPKDVESELNLPVLSAIPKSSADTPAHLALQDPRSALSEAYYSVRTALQFSTENGAPASLLVSSSGPSEGKTTTSLALAIGFARLNKRVLLIDADMRKPSMHKLLGCDNGKGLSNLLAGGPEVAAAVQATSHENLVFLACGPPPPNPAELLGGNAMRRVLAFATARFEVVVIDGPPVMGLADAPLLANVTGAVVFVVASGETKRDMAKVALQRLRLGQARVLGAVLTKFDLRKAGYGHGYSYGYEYGEGAPAQKASVVASVGDWLKGKAA